MTTQFEEGVPLRASVERLPRIEKEKGEWGGAYPRSWRGDGAWTRVRVFE